MPYADFCYVADSAHCPYGDKSAEEIVALSMRITNSLVRRCVGMIIVACNTASTAAIGRLRKTYDIPFVGIEPAVKPAAVASKSGVIGVLATRGTISSDFYNSTRQRFASGVRVIAVAGDGLVEAVESGHIHSPGTRKLLKRYLQPMLDEGADQIVLGCTHYPFLIEEIQSITGSRVTVINPAPAVARRAEEIRAGMNAAAGHTAGTDAFYTTGSTRIMRSFLRTITGRTYEVREYADAAVSSACP